jgi:hypothetical protein
MNVLNKISIVFLLISGVFLSSWTYTHIKDEAIENNADFEAVPRRCRVVKRYRAKGEVYRIIVDVNNNSNWQNGSIEILFEPKEGQPKPTTEPIILKPIKSKGKNGKDIEFESDEFEFSGDVSNTKYNFFVLVKNSNKEVLKKFQYVIEFGAASKGTETIDAKLIQ